MRLMSLSPDLKFAAVFVKRNESFPCRMPQIFVP